MAASARLESGPARLTHIMSLPIFLKLRGFTGTGFAHPKSPEKKSISVPMGSRCFMGLSVTLPSIFAVGSPSLLATHACAHSCMVRASSMGGAVSMIFSIYPCNMAHL